MALLSSFYVPTSRLSARTIRYRDEEQTVDLVEGGHYQISGYFNGRLYSVYNDHIDNNVDNRRNLSAIMTIDGKTWTNINEQTLTPPIAFGELEAQIYSSDVNLVYLKDLIVDENGELRILFVEATTEDPTQGERELKEWTSNGVQTLSQVGHNYNSASYFTSDDALYVAAVLDGNGPYMGGDLGLFRLDDDNYNLIHKLTDEIYAYVRPVLNGGLNGIGSIDISTKFKEQGSHIAFLIDADKDEDGMTASWEERYGLSDANASDADTDIDSDGVSNFEEYVQGANPTLGDSDGDGLTDAEEFSLGTDLAEQDTDGDGLVDLAVRRSNNFT